MANVSKEESVLLIQHAISAIKNEGETQRDLATYLEVEQPRLTEAKKGKWKIGNSQRQLIIDRFGYPRRGKGEYIKAELYGTVSKFIDDFESSSKARYKRRLYQLFTRSDYQQLIGSYFRLSDFSDVDIDKALNLKLECLEKLLILGGFTQWIDAQRENESKERSISAIEASILHEAGLMISSFVDSSVYVILYKLGLFKLYVMPSFTFISSESVPSLTNTELVLSGDVVLNYSKNVKHETLNSVGNFHGAYGRSFFPIYSGKLGGEHIQSGAAINSMPDRWDSAEMRLFLSESMEYHLVIHLIKEAHMYDIGGSRSIVVTCIDRIGFLQELELIRKWLGLPHDMYDQVKSEIAKVGGFIPGARVL